MITLMGGGTYRASATILLGDYERVVGHIDAISLVNCVEVACNAEAAELMDGSCGAGCDAENRAEKTHAGEVAVMEREAEDGGRG